MRIFIGRALKQSLETESKLHELGFETHIFPLKKLQPLQNTFPEDHFDCVIFTSQNAVEAYKQLNYAKSLPAFVVGNKTAKACEELGIKVQHNADGTIQDLIALIDTDSDLQNASYFYPTTANAKTDLENYFLEKNIHFVRQNIYKLQPVEMFDAKTVSFFQEGQIGQVLLYSDDFARHFFSLAYTANLYVFLEKVQFICISSSVAQKIPSEFSKNILIAKHTNEASMFDMLKKLAKNIE